MPESERGNTRTLQSDDPRIAAAAEEAQRRWGEFERSFRAGEPDTKHFVKHGFPTADGRLEHMWVAVARIDDQAISGRLANGPIGDVGVAFGDEVTLVKAEVEDWKINHPDHTYEGYFSEEAVEE